MRAVLALLVFTGLVVRVQAEELPPVDAAIDQELPIPSNVFLPPPPPKEVPPMRVEAATTRQLPTHQITVVRGEASTLPDIPPPPEPKPFVPGRVGEPYYQISFGATVYDHKISRVRWHDPRSKQNFEAWCAWDWTLLSPASNIKLGDRVRSISLFASNINTVKQGNFRPFAKMPPHPALEENGFVIVNGDADDPEATRILTMVRDYYVKNKDRLLQIRQAREEYQAAAAAWHAANPPKPENHTIWLKPHRGSRYLQPEGTER